MFRIGYRRQTYFIKHLNNMTNVWQKAEKNHDFKMASLPEGDGGKK